MISSGDIKKVFDRVKKTKRPIIVMANNQPQVAIVSVQTLEKYTQLEQEQEFWNSVEEIRTANTDRSPDEVYEDVTKIVGQIRRERYEKTRDNA